jgi:hypothetical protein
MQPVHEFLKAVEARLRCPLDRQPEVIDELRSHLEDRVQSLVQRGSSEADAERQAVREMRPGWLLAFRLSAGNGWSVFAHVLRGLWAAGLGIEVAVACLSLLLAVDAAVEYASNVSSGLWVLIGCTHMAALAGLLGLSFALGRIARGWLWALVPGCALAQMSRTLAARAAGVEGLPGIAEAYAPIMEISAAVVLLAAVLVVAAAVLGQRRSSPRLTWLAWASGSLIALSAFGIWAWGTMTFGAMSPSHELLHGLPAVTQAIGGVFAPGSAWVPGMAAILLPWAFWLGAWAIERTNRVAPRDLASSS